MDEQVVLEGLVEAIRAAATQLPSDVIAALKAARAHEQGVGAVQLDAILENIDVAGTSSVPMCQDTGIQTFVVRVGAEFPLLGRLRALIEEAVRRATASVPLRPNTVDSLRGGNPGDNTGRFIPYILWEIESGSGCEIHLLPKGGGSENCSALRMLAPGAGIGGVKRFVLDHVVACGGKPCPPGVIGVGIGGGSDLAMKLAKLSLLRAIGRRHEDPIVADLELELLARINESGVGVMGLGGPTTALDVHIEVAHRHPASLPVGLVYQCWADRRKTVLIDAVGRVEVV
jgi:fumarate hydratase subunit alpha